MDYQQHFRLTQVNVFRSRAILSRKKEVQRVTSKPAPRSPVYGLLVKPVFGVFPIDPHRNPHRASQNLMVRKLDALDYGFVAVVAVMLISAA